MSLVIRTHHQAAIIAALLTLIAALLALMEGLR